MAACTAEPVNVETMCHNENNTHQYEYLKTQLNYYVAYSWIRRQLIRPRNRITAAAAAA